MSSTILSKNRDALDNIFSSGLNSLAKIGSDLLPVWLEKELGLQKGDPLLRDGTVPGGNPQQNTSLQPLSTQNVQSFQPPSTVKVGGLNISTGVLIAGGLAVVGGLLLFTRR